MLVRKSRKMGLALAWVLVAALTGCATGPQSKLSEEAASRIRTIALLDIAEPPVDQILHRGTSKESHSSTYAQMLTDAQVEFAPLLAEAITRQLERSNYRVQSLPTQRPIVYGDDQIDLSSINTDADAILVVRFKSAGYTSTTTTALQPWAIVEAQLFDTRTRVALYTQTFNGGADLGISGAVHLATNARFQYASPEQIESKLEDSVDGIKDAELAIADVIGQDLAVGTRPVAGYVETARPAAAPEMTAAERDREAAAALAAQWAAAAPPPAPAVDIAPAATDDNAPANAAANATPETQGAGYEPQAPASMSAPAPNDVATPDSPQRPSSAAELAGAVTAPESAALTMPAPPPAPILPETSTTSSSDPVSEAANDADQTAATAAPVPASSVDTPPAIPAVPAPPVVRAPASAESTLVLKQRTPVRVSPTSRATVFAFLPAGTSFTRGQRVIRNGSGHWCFIEAGEITGWVTVEDAQP